MQPVVIPGVPGGGGKVPIGIYFPPPVTPANFARAFHQTISPFGLSRVELSPNLGDVWGQTKSILRGMIFFLQFDKLSAANPTAHADQKLQAREGPSRNSL